MKRAWFVLGAWSLFAGSAAAAGRPMRIEDVLGMRRPSDPQLSPDGTRAAFEAREWNREKDRFDKHIYVAGLRAPSFGRAVSGAGSEWQPRFGADGTLAFLSDRDGSAAVYALASTGGEPRRLFKHPAAISGFEWSPDGKAIVFLAADSDPKPSITKPVIVVDEEPLSSRAWRWNAGDGTVKPLTEPAPYVVEAVVSPDSRKVAYLAEPSPRFLESFQRELYVMPLAGGPSQRLTTNQDAEFDARWSPDGPASASSPLPTTIRSASVRRASTSWPRAEGRSASSPGNSRATSLSTNGWTTPTSSSRPACTSTSVCSSSRAPTRS